MTRLILIRHAKSSWEDGYGDDHDRPLNPRGKRDAAAMGRWLEAEGYRPDVTLCSDAVRTRETAKLLDMRGRLDLRPTLYHAAPQTMLAEINAISAPVIALIGHNPGMAILAASLVELRPDHPRFGDYPTCAVTVIDFLEKIDVHLGQVQDFKIPRDL